MKRINLGAITGPGLVGSILLGFFIPSLAVLKPAMPYLLMFMLFLSFVRLQFKLGNFIRKELLYFPAVVLLILPFVIAFLTRNMEPAYRIGFFIVSITPQALGSPVIVDGAYGDRELIIANVVLYNLLAPFIFAFLTKFHLGADVAIDVVGIMLNVAKIVFIPLGIALVVRRFEKAKIAVNKVARVFNTLALFMIVAAAVSSSTDRLKNAPLGETLTIFGLTMLLASSLFAVGYIISLKNEKMRRTLPVVLGHKNTVLTILVALSNFSGPAAIPAVLYLISHHLLNSLHMGIFSRFPLKEESRENIIGTTKEFQKEK